ncbi:MAG: UDP-N-acetylmuramoyl-L-alanyl-D-glutamate--2,6-diaminopimelate ligase [Chloroflexi bacterium]|nr:UDP-N-acetylmuramoyl-L-alanyl-D-glutamate--2,6-diaminopimelate ligase [Chloroflexota bacterium]
MTGFIQHTLQELFAEIPGDVLSTVPDLTVTGIVSDSRLVQPGNLFVALQGATTDGHRFIPTAVEHGAAAVVGTQPLQNVGVPYIQVVDGRLALAYLAAGFYSFPARQLTVIGVTGTDGKTTTANLIYEILMEAGYPTGIISTVNATISGEVVDTGFHVTTPDTPDIQRYLARMVAAGLSHVVLEATSHGLAQGRVLACEFDVGVITNITHEHLDYHGTFEAYRAAKASLFTSLAETHAKRQGNPRTAVLNRDDDSYEYLDRVTSTKKISYGFDSRADVRAEDIVSTSGGTRFTAVGPGFFIPVESRMVGAYNVSNCLAAVAATVASLGSPTEAAQKGIAGMGGVPGRMEQIDLGQDFTAIVDFAHTPNALQRSLETTRGLTHGRVWVVFGSAGLRDREKRRLMAEVAVAQADATIFTAEDPRTESLDSILEEMAHGASTRGAREGETFWRIPDRREAIRFAIRNARPGDLVIACGKGHEQSMCFGEIEYPWDDRVAMRAALAERLGISGPEMPYLPV